MTVAKMNLPTEHLRIPPHSAEAEQSVLAAIMHYGKQDQQIREAMDMLGPDMFYQAFHVDIFRTIQSLDSTDAVPVADEMVRLNLIEPSMFADVVALAKSSFTKSGLSKYVEIIRERHAQRHIIGLANNVIEQMYNGESADNAIAELTDQAGQLDTSTVYEPTHVSEMVAEWIELADQRATNDERIVGQKTGIKSLDEQIVGIGSTWLFILAGRPSHGKSLFAQLIANNISLEGEVLFMSMEMTNREIMDRFVAMLAKVDPADIRRASLTQEQWARVTVLLKDAKAGRYGLFYDDTPSLSLDQVCARVKSFKRKHPNCKLIQIDYLGLMQTPKADRNDLGVAAITKRLKQLSKEIETPVMLLAQLNREADKAKRPAMHNLADSAAIERDADIVMFTHNLGVAHPDVKVAKGNWILSCGKFRHGPQPSDIYMSIKENDLVEIPEEDFAVIDNLINKPAVKKRGMDIA